MTAELLDLGKVPTADQSDLLMARFLDDPCAAVFAEIHQYFYWELCHFVEAHVEGQFLGDIDDVVQQTFIDFFEIRHRIQPGTRLRAFLYQITDNNLKDHLRAAEAQKRDHHRTCQMWQQGPGFDVDIKAKALWAAEQSRQRLAEFMARLPENQAAVLRLVWLENHTEPEAAEIMGQSLSTIKWWIKDAKDRIRTMHVRDEAEDNHDDQ